MKWSRAPGFCVAYLLLALSSVGTPGVLAGADAPSRHAVALTAGTTPTPSFASEVDHSKGGNKTISAFLASVSKIPGQERFKQEGNDVELIRLMDSLSENHEHDRFNELIKNIFTIVHESSNGSVEQIVMQRKQMKVDMKQGQVSVSHQRAGTQMMHKLVPGPPPQHPTTRPPTLPSTSPSPTPPSSTSDTSEIDTIMKDLKRKIELDAREAVLRVYNYDHRHDPKLDWPESHKYDYDQVLRLSLLFYEAQRSGRLPASNRIPWRGDSALHDHGERGEDLSGGYYDAGDFVKFGFTMAYTTTMLAWGLSSYSEAYRAAGQWEVGVDAVRWAADYFMRCHASPDELYGQVGDFTLDHQYWGRPEELNMTRPAYKIDREHPGSDLAGETAAALAAVALVTNVTDPEYSARCVQHARELYSLANKYRGLYHDAIKGAAQYYESTDYGDELCWAAAWLYRATGERDFLDEAEDHYTQFLLGDRPEAFFYNRKVAGVQVLLAQLTGVEEYSAAARRFCDHSVLHQKRTPKGLVYVKKAGTLCHAANIAFVCLQAADAGINPKLYRDFARQQIYYILGDAGRSFVVGFGSRSPTQPHHAASSCPDRPAVCDWTAFSREAPNPQVLEGALVSGPDENDFYKDVRQEYVYNEVTLDYNAGFQSAVAGLRYLQLHNSNPMPTAHHTPATAGPPL